MEMVLSLPIQLQSGFLLSQHLIPCSNTKLLAEIIPESPDGPPNVRKIMNYLEEFPHIPKAAKFLEQRSRKELHPAHVNFVQIIASISLKPFYSFVRSRLTSGCCYKVSFGLTSLVLTTS